VNGLQVLIAKGRKNKRRGALAGNYAPVHVSGAFWAGAWHAAVLLCWIKMPPCLAFPALQQPQQPL
jgi:hypothetical protein